jgi:hypothetical protein
MITLDVVQEGGTPIAAMISGLASQIPFASSVALNLTANSAQSAVRGSLPGEFTLRRRSFVEQTIYRKPGQDFATKANLVAAVRVNPERDFLAKFQDGGQKTSIAGKSLAVPILRLETPSIIIQRGDPMNVKMLMAAIQVSGGRVLRVGRVSKKNGTITVKRDPNKVFLVKSAKGTFIVQRTGPGSTKVLYEFQRAVPIKPQLHFEEIAYAAAIAAWDANWDAALLRAIETMR